MFLPSMKDSERMFGQIEQQFLMKTLRKVGIEKKKFPGIPPPPQPSNLGLSLIFLKEISIFYLPVFAGTHKILLKNNGDNDRLYLVPDCS